MRVYGTIKACLWNLCGIGRIDVPRAIGTAGFLVTKNGATVKRGTRGSGESDSQSCTD
jgi:hypothetical protein